MWTLRYLRSNSLGFIVQKDFASKQRLIKLFFFTVVILVTFGAANSAEILRPSKADLESFLTDAETSISQGDNQQAHTFYNKFLAHEPKNVATLIKRATLRNNLGLFSEALSDWKTVVISQPSTSLAHLKRAELQIKLGYYDDATSSLVSAEKDKEFLNENRKAASDYKNLINECKELNQSLNVHLLAGEWAKALGSIERLLKISPNAGNIRRIRVDALLALRSPTFAISELKSLVRQESTLDDLARLADLLYHTLYDVQSARNTIRRCMQLDPEHSKCMAVHKEISTYERLLSNAKAAAITSTAESKKTGNAKRASNAAKKYSCVPKTSDSNNESEISSSRSLTAKEIKLAKELHRAAASFRVHKFAEQHAAIANEFSKAACLAFRGIAPCRAAIAHDGTCAECLDALVDTLLTDYEDYKAAISTINKLMDTPAGRQIEQQLKDLREKVLKLEGDSSRVDYYEVLGVTKDATQRDIRKAFLNRARHCHPDKVRGIKPDDAKELMAKINSAYQVLSKAESRAQYDNGIDPNDPNTQRGGHGGFNPFEGGMPMHSFFQQGGGQDGPFQFHFT